MLNDKNEVRVYHIYPEMSLNLKLPDETEPRHPLPIGHHGRGNVKPANNHQGIVQEVQEILLQRLLVQGLGLSCCRPASAALRPAKQSKQSKTAPELRSPSSQSWKKPQFCCWILSASSVVKSRQKTPSTATKPAEQVAARISPKSAMD